MSARFILLCMIICMTASAFADTAEPYRDLSTAGVGFLGPGREDPPPENPTTVRIGLFGPEKNPDGDRLRAGVELAVAEANARGGYNGISYEVVFRADDGPWGMGAKQVTALAHEDSVWVILGGLEGGDAHLAELVAAKVWAPVITPTASDMTIDYANVPWIFRCFPSDANQAGLLIRYARSNGYERLLVITEADREGLTGQRRVRAAAESQDQQVLEYIEYQSHRPEAAVRRSLLESVDAVLVWGRSASGQRLIREIRGAGFDGPVLAPAGLLNPDLIAHVRDLGELIVAAPYDLAREDLPIRQLRDSFEQGSGRRFDAIALFAYDATRLTIGAIEKAGLNRARIRDVLAESRYGGIAGTMGFDGLGGTTLDPILMSSSTGKWLPIAETKGQ